MTTFKMTAGPCTVTLTGFAHNQPVWSGPRRKIYEGPTVELTLTFPHDDPGTFNVPFTCVRQKLKTLVASHGGILSTKEDTALEELILAFAKYIVDNHSWYKPYRSPTDAEAEAEAAEEAELVDKWF